MLAEIYTTSSRWINIYRDVITKSAHKMYPPVVLGRGGARDSASSDSTYSHASIHINESHSVPHI